MIVPSSLVAVICKIAGIESGSIASEWYLVALKLFGISLNNFLPLCEILDVRPWISSGAREIFAPYAAAIT